MLFRTKRVMGWMALSWDRAKWQKIVRLQENHESWQVCWVEISSEKLLMAECAVTRTYKPTFCRGVNCGFTWGPCMILIYTISSGVANRSTRCWGMAFAATTMSTRVFTTMFISRSSQSIIMCEFITCMCNYSFFLIMNISCLGWRLLQCASWIVNLLVISCSICKWIRKIMCLVSGYCHRM